jgi:flagellin
MTRINTNVSSLTAQKTLARSNVQLQEALTRLSTGLRINVGKDDPAGLIASEALRSDIVSTQRAITNSERADQMIGTADSALSQVGSLLTDIRGLVTEAANKGALSDAQIAANQLQVDSSLDALNRIAQTTTFQGRRLLDGSLDFITGNWTNQNTVSDLEIDSANLGTTGSMPVSVDISAAASQAQITNDIPAASAAVKAQAVITFKDTSAVTVTAHTAGAASNGVQVQFVTDASVTAGEAVAYYNGSDKIIVKHNGDTAKATIATAINGLTEFDAVSGGGGVGYVDANDGDGVKGTTAGGADAVNGLLDDLVFELSGSKGTQVFGFQQDATADQIAAAINLVSDATGVTANNNAGTLELTSAGYGSNAFVAVNVISEGALGTFETNLSASRTAGTDIAANVNGIAANGDGNKLSINTATLAMSATVTDGSSTDFSFTISGGGAMFQLGPDVVSNQQARLGIQSVNSATLGGVSGRLYELGSGGSAALATDPSKAASILEEVISKVSSLRGRLGAFQKTTIDSNKTSLSDTLGNLTAAESSIRDADFAAESANLTRAQILVQAGTSVLAVANRAPENVLALLR